MYAVPRRHGVDDEDHGAHSGGGREGQGSRPAARPVGEHDGQDYLRALRLMRGAGRERDQEVPRRVRGILERETGDGKRETAWLSNWSIRRLTGLRSPSPPAP